MCRTIAVALVLVAAATPAMAVYTDGQLRERVRQAAIDHHLYAQPDRMGYIIIRNAQPGVDEVELREDHESRKCGNDHRAAHRLFEVCIDRKTGKMATDAADPVDGGLQIIK